jgi:hypothetical protein
MPNERTKGALSDRVLLAPRPVLQWPKPELTRRRSADHRHNCWHIYYVLRRCSCRDDCRARRQSALIPIRGNGAAVSIQARIQANISPTPPRLSKKPARISSTHGRCSCRTAPRLIFRHGAIREIGPNRNMRCGTPKRLEPSSHGPGKPRGHFMKCPCGAVFDLHGPEAVLMHVPDNTSASQRSRT